MLILFALTGCLAHAVQFSLTFTQAANLLGGLKGLDGYTKLDANNRSTPVMYDFSGNTRKAIRKDIAALQPKIDELTTVNRDIMVAAGIVDMNKATVDQVAVTNKKWADATKDPIIVDLDVITEADLNLDSNPIPGSVTAALVVIESAPPTPKK